MNETSTNQLIQTPTPQPDTNKKKSHFKITISIFLITIIITGITITTYKLHSKNNSQLKKIPTPPPTPTPMPFQEITIPYLRKQTYKSKLNTLEKITENESYTTYTTNYKSDGLQINGLLTQPKTEKPKKGFPAIIFIHGYIPPAQYQTLGPAYSYYIDYLARNGFTIFKIDLRGHADSEGKPTGAYYSAGYIIDTLNAYSALQNSDFINPKKIGLWGHSMGGNVVLRSLATQPTTIPAAVIWSGAVYSYSDLKKYGINDPSHQPNHLKENQSKRQLLTKLYGDPQKNNTFWQQISPVSYLKDIKGAIQLHHATDDEVVNIEYSKDLNNILDKTSIPHEFHQYPSGGHNISDYNFNQAISRTVEFFKKYL